MILNSSETSGPFSNGRILKMYSLEVHVKPFGGQKGGLSELPRTPPTYRPEVFEVSGEMPSGCSLYVMFVVTC